MLNVNTLLKKCADTRHRNLDGEGIVVKQTAGEVLVLNEVGVRVLDLLESEASVRDLLDTLATEYAIDRSTLEQDLHLYLQELVDAQVIERVMA
ncbi:MAG: PqqD family protein [Candidatus Contendobacter sp.]